MKEKMNIVIKFWRGLCFLNPRAKKHSPEEMYIDIYYVTDDTVMCNMSHITYLNVTNNANMR